VARLRDATRLRCAGLALARAGKTGAAQSISRAGELLEQTQLGREAFMFGLSVQAPAEAYIAYKDGNHSGASSKLYDALDALSVLADQYGHDVVIRRAHLGRNLLVTLRLAGRFDIAGPLAVQLLMWIAGMRGWPLCGADAGFANLPEEEHEVAVDQIVAELGRLAMASPSSVGLSSVLCAKYPDAPTWLRVRAFLHLIAARLGGDPAAWAKATAHYLELGCGRLWQMRRMVASLAA
jgi:hypothetical protein